MLSLADPAAVAAVMARGTAVGSGLQFLPVNVVDTQVGPVSHAPSRQLNVIVGENVTPLALARELLPLWLTATPFTPPGAAAPLPFARVTADELARALLAYNQSLLPVTTMEQWRPGFRFPLPVDVDPATGIATLYPDDIRSLAASFLAAWEPTLFMTAVPPVAVTPAQLTAEAAAFLAAQPDAAARGSSLAAQALINASATRPLVLEVFNQLGVGAWEVALGFMESIVNWQTAVLAAQSPGGDILAAINTALGAAPAALSAAQQASLRRSTIMLGAVAGMAGAAVPSAFTSGAPGAAGVDLLAGTHPVTPTEHATVEQVLSPGSTLVAPPVGAPPGTAPTIAPPPAMTGGGVGGAFQVDMLNCLRTSIQAFASAFRTNRAAGASYPMSDARLIATEAQTQVESYFRPYIVGATRQAADAYHPGTTSATTLIHDQSTRPISDNGTSTNPGRLGWTQYWMSNSSICGGTMTAHNCSPDIRHSPDETEFLRVRDLFVNANRTDIDDAIHGWPAEATGGIFIQPFSGIGAPADMRRQRWDLFTTILHEFLHVMTHPNYQRAFSRMGGARNEILKEGMTDVMRHDLWDGPGRLVDRLATSAMAPVRNRVEGSFQAAVFNAADIQYHPDYPNMADAQSVANAVGMPNTKAAYFLGHVEFLGLGAGTGTSASLANVAMWTATDSANAEVVVAHTGDTLAGLEAMTNALPGSIVDVTSGSVLAAGSALTSGQQLRVPGIRHHIAIQGDTLGSVSAQHSVTTAALARANRLPPSTASGHSVAVGTRLIVPLP